MLEGLGFRATVFLPTGVIDGTSTFAWYHDEQPALLNWEEVCELDGGALSFEAHTVTHPNLLLLDDDASRREITQSKLDLEARLGRPVDAFCYPAGLFGERERNFVDEAGYRVAVTCEPGVNVPGADLLTLRRRQIDPRDRRLDFRAKVGGGHDTPLPLRGVYRRLRYGEGSEPQPAPTAVTRPRRVTSPVMAMSFLIGMPVSTETIAVAMAAPADGPSFGVAPSGTWMWTSVFSNCGGSMPNFVARLRT